MRFSVVLGSNVGLKLAGLPHGHRRACLLSSLCLCSIALRTVEEGRGPGFIAG